MGAGLGVGMGFGMGGVMGGMMGQMAQGAANAQPIPTPPAPMQVYVYADNQQSGPFDATQLKQLAVQGVLTKDTLVWKQGCHSGPPHPLCQNFPPFSSHRRHLPRLRHL